MIRKHDFTFQSKVISKVNPYQFELGNTTNKTLNVTYNLEKDFANGEEI